MAWMGAKTTGTSGKMVLPGRPGPERKHYCPAHDVVMTPIKTYGKKGTMFECKEGCRLSKHYTILK
jgi:hypothetical protein